MTTVPIRRDWAGRVVQQNFPLLAWLGGSDSCGVFLTGQLGEPTVKAAIKLMPADAAEDRVASWAAAQELDHPHLLRLYEHGRCQMDGAEFAYVVTEFAPEVLAEILAERALSAEEARGVLEPLLRALEYLHGKGLVHGHLKPTNIMAIEDSLKLSVDHLLPWSTAVTASTRGVYDAPEVLSGVMTPAADVWSLGVTLLEVLTQKRPVYAANGEVMLPKISEPFGGIVQKCLRLDPAQRCGLPEIQARLHPEEKVAKPVEAATVTPAQKSASAVRPATGTAKPATDPAKKDESVPLALRMKILIAAIVVVIVLIGVRAAWNHHRPAVAAQEASVASQTAPASQAAPAAQQDSTATAQGTVAERVSPDVLPRALATIRGTVRVDVRVTAAADGNIVHAVFADHGPSHYFANAAMKAAQQWKFHPAQANGQPVKSVWLLKFEFKQGGENVTATEVSP